MKSQKKILIYIVLIGICIFSVIYYFKHTDSDPSGKTESISVETQSDKIKSPSGYTLIIDKLHIEAPISLNVNGNDKDTYFKKLEVGVAHLEGTSLPGESGNSFIFGHSSYYPDKPGNYKEVFKQLDKLVVGDQIIVRRINKEVIYKLSETKIIDPSDVSVVQNTTDARLTLSTCWPPGTTEKRLIIIAEKD